MLAAYLERLGLEQDCFLAYISSLENEDLELALKVQIHKAMILVHAATS